jgi:hypothetical protein
VVEKANDCDAVLGDIGSLCKAHICDESDSERYVEVAPEMPDLAWLAVVLKHQVGDLQIVDGFAIEVRGP